MTFSKPLAPFQGDPEVLPPRVRSFSALEIDQFARQAIGKKFEQLHEDPRPFSAFILNVAGELQMVCFACSWVEDVNPILLRSSKSKDVILHRHPVVLARRALIRYLLKEARTFETNGSTSSVLCLNDEGEFQLKPSCHVYFYSTFSYISSEDGHDSNHCIVNKIRRWLSLGVQGALLSNVFSPVFISKIVYGSDPPTLTADISRLLSLPGLPQERKISVESVERLALEGPNKRTIVWFQGFTGHDVILETGRLEGGVGSSVCKEEIFRTYLQLKASDKKVLKYSRAKKRAGHYQMLKQVLYKKWEQENNGKWLKRKKNKADKFWLEPPRK